MQELVQECGEVCGGLALPLPVPVSTFRSMDKQHVYGELLRASQHPERAIPLTPSLRVRIPLIHITTNMDTPHGGRYNHNGNTDHYYCHRHESCGHTFEQTVGGVGWMKNT
jgi:hypothetical protein